MDLGSASITAIQSSCKAPESHGDLAFCAKCRRPDQADQLESGVAGGEGKEPYHCDVEEAARPVATARRCVQGVDLDARPSGLSLVGEAEGWMVWGREIASGMGVRCEGRRRQCYCGRQRTNLRAGLF
nr:unnamed protein product [Digitaria exilis]